METPRNRHLGDLNFRRSVRRGNQEVVEIADRSRWDVCDEARGQSTRTSNPIVGSPRVRFQFFGDFSRGGEKMAIGQPRDPRA